MSPARQRAPGPSHPSINHASSSASVRRSPRGRRPDRRPSLRPRRHWYGRCTPWRGHAQHWRPVNETALSGGIRPALHGKLMSPEPLGCDPGVPGPRADGSRPTTRGRVDRPQSGSGKGLVAIRSLPARGKHRAAHARITSHRRMSCLHVVSADGEQVPAAGGSQRFRAGAWTDRMRGHPWSV